ncbi:MAG: uroporphyrinogen-III C-methyltransferase [Hyphomicrobiaceae bacterium]|nr:MAG: uroporphyrinogen-III C-methyltransferase [Hyphomicrobiaceae bacterium]
MEQLPISLDLKGKKVVVTGGGAAAARKTELALRAGARVLVVAQHLGEEFHELSHHPCLTFRAGSPAPEDFAGAVVAFAASTDHAEDALSRDMARANGALVNVPDRPELCDFSMPSIVDRSPLLIAISSAGTSPLLTRIIKERLESTIPAAYGTLARFLGSIREQVAERIRDNRSRRHFLEKIVDGPVADLVLAGDEARAWKQLEAEIDAHGRASGVSPVGEVYLVGGGPGDPDLLTFRALRLLQRADVVVYDRLIGSPILDLVRRDAERIYVGKMKNKHELPQEEISRLLVKLAREGKRVLRLKGGDPFIFGRGGEEIEMLAGEGIPFQVVPGITAASGCASYAGIPLTHRDHAQSCVFVTGHAKNGRLDLDWASLLQPRQTVAVYMGLAMLPELTRDFIAHGADPNTPVAIVDSGTRPNQQVVTGTIGTIADLAAAAGLTGPSMIFIGTVVRLRDKLGWFKPLPGRSADVAAARAAGEDARSSGPTSSARGKRAHNDRARRSGK